MTPPIAPERFPASRRAAEITRVDSGKTALTGVCHAIWFAKFGHH
jgi:hypothetical protein